MAVDISSKKTLTDKENEGHCNMLYMLRLVKKRFEHFKNLAKRHLSPARGLQRQLISTNFQIMLFAVLFFTTLMSSQLMWRETDKALSFAKNKMQEAQLFLLEHVRISPNFEDNKQKAELKQLAPYIEHVLRAKLAAEIQLVIPSEQGNEFIYDDGYPLNKLLASQLSYKSSNQSNNEKAPHLLALFHLKHRRFYLSVLAPFYDVTNVCRAYIYLGFDLQSELLNVLYFFIWTLGESFLLLSLIYYLLLKNVRKLTTSLQSLTQKMRVFRFVESGNLPVSSGENEISELNNNFVAMHDEIAGYVTELKQEKERQTIFFSNVTHNLKTPLTSIIGYSDVILQTANNDEACEAALIIQEAGEDLLLKINNLLSLSSLQVAQRKLNFAYFYPDLLIKEVFGLLKLRLERQKIEYTTDMPDNLLLQSDRSALYEILLCLIDNIIVHSECNKVNLKLEPYESSGRKYLRMSIADNGKGMSKLEQTVLFEPFYRTKVQALKGSGLGLAFCKEMLARLDGQIGLHSELKRGTTVIISLPLEHI